MIVQHAARSENRREIAFAYAVLCLLPSTTWIAIKIGLSGTPPLLGAGIRFAVASPCLLVFLVGTRSTLRVPRAAWPLLFRVALLMFAIPYGLIYLAETRLSTGLTALLFGSMPLFVVLIANRARPPEPLTAVKLAGVGVGIAGLAVVFAGGLALSSAPTKVLAMCGMLAAAGSTAWAQVGSRGAERTVPLSVLVAWGSALAGLALLLLALAVEGPDLTVDGRTVGSALYLGVTAAAGFRAMLWLLGRIDSVYVSLHALVVPLLSLAWGAAVYGEPLTIAIGVGATIVALGVALVTAGGVVPRRRRSGGAAADELAPGGDLVEQLGR